ncbi:hypothetical protein Vafri_20759 [Volvox africanus]|uniref:Uncharacterized protein n=1 Tax=Volvox africanus TaxID=51714 RepID=A0A8J4BS17_9CHLO|nr:hypothetical protein Vafri_20759 [Volvox africanus]
MMSMPAHRTSSRNATSATGSPAAARLHDSLLPLLLQPCRTQTAAAAAAGDGGGGVQICTKGPMLTMLQLLLLVLLLETMSRRLQLSRHHWFRIVRTLHHLGSMPVRRC